MTVAANPYFHHLPEDRRRELAELDTIEPYNLFDEIDLIRIVTARALSHIHALRELDPKRCLVNEIEIILSTIPVINRLLNTILFIARANSSTSSSQKTGTPDSPAGSSPQISGSSPQASGRDLGGTSKGLRVTSPSNRPGTIRFDSFRVARHDPAWMLRPYEKASVSKVCVKKNYTSAGGMIHGSHGWRDGHGCFLGIGPQMNTR